MIVTDVAVNIRNLTFYYPDGQCGLKDINLTVDRGDSVALIGPNGAGKSTLLLHLNGILRSSAAVSVCGFTLDDKNIKEIRKRVGMVFQDPEDQLFSLNVFEDVAFGPFNVGLKEEEISLRVSSALAKVGMAGYEKRSPHHLSIGEKKRIALATVLSMDPELLALDEPTSSLDPRGKWSLIELLNNLPITRVIASHDLDLVRCLCRRVILLDGGVLVADGQTGDILDNYALLREHGLAKPDQPADP